MEELMKKRSLAYLATTTAVVCGSLINATDCLAQSRAHIVSRPVTRLIQQTTADDLSSPPIPAAIKPAATTPTVPTQIVTTPAATKPAGRGRYWVAFADPAALPATPQNDASAIRFQFEAPAIDSADNQEFFDDQSAKNTINDLSTADQDIEGGLENLETDIEKESRDNDIRRGDDQEQSGVSDPSKTSDFEKQNENEDETEYEGEDEGEQNDDGDQEVTPKRSRQFGTWPRKSMRQVNVSVRDTNAVVPDDESNVLSLSSQRFYNGDAKTQKVFAWTAANIRHQPLYFEDVASERYGQTHGIVKQPFVSAFKFLRDAALLPANAAIDCPGSCDTPLGFRRPGSPQDRCGCAKCDQCSKR